MRIFETPRVLRTVLTGSVLFACSDGTAPVIDPPPPSPDAVVRVLFIGNSLTAGNDLPGMVSGLAAAAGRAVVVEESLMPGSSLEDHWELTDARQRIARGRFDYVVLQQGPSALEESRVYLREWTAKWAPVIRAAGGRPALYAPWPTEQRAFDFPRVSDSYRLAAEDVNGIFLPAGDAWLRTWELDRSMPLYGDDRFHPSVHGTYAAAVVIAARLLDLDPRDFPNEFSVPSRGTIVIEQNAARTIQQGAYNALAGTSGAIPNESSAR
jgi:hypothetical protein